MAISTPTKNAMLDAGFVDGDKLCLHETDPGTTVGAGEITGGSPAYARKTIDYDNASGGSKLLNGTLVFDIPAGGDVNYYSIIDTAASVVKSSGAVASPESFTNQGTYTVTEITLSI